MKTGILSLLVGFAAAFVAAPLVIKIIKRIKGGQPILNYVESHKTKEGTPTMGGIIFLLGILVSYLAFFNNNSVLAGVSVAVTFSYALLGFLDDFIKVHFKHNEGLKPYQKVIGQVGIAVLAAVFVYLNPLVGTEIIVPFTDITLNLSWAIIPFVMFILIAITNSVNLTDGLDGLAGGVTLTYLAGFFAILCLHLGKMEYMGESTLLVQEMQGIINLVGGSIGALVAFLCFNSHPAKVFMGDTGSLALGGLIGITGVLTKFELLIPMLGFMFVLSAVSVIMQVLYYKKTKKRIFLMAPLHHHFEKKGSYETKITTIYIIITMLITLTVIYFYI